VFVHVHVHYFLNKTKIEVINKFSVTKKYIKSTCVV